jgi:hypothetical protein
MKKNELTVIDEVVSEEQILDAAQDFLTASIETVGVNSTHDTLKFMAETIWQQPDTYRKIFHPDTLDAINALFEKSNSGKIGMMDIMSVFSELSTIFK